MYLEINMCRVIYSVLFGPPQGCAIGTRGRKKSSAMFHLNYTKETVGGSIVQRSFLERSGLRREKLQQNMDDSVHASLMACKGE